MRPDRLTAGEAVGGAAGQPGPGGGRGRATGQELRGRGVAFGGRAARTTRRAALPLAHGGGAAQSRGGLRRISGSASGRGCDHSSASSRSSTASAPGATSGASSWSGSSIVQPEVVLLGADLGRRPGRGLRGDARRGRGRRARAADARAAGLRGLAPRPVLERRADREGAREAVRLLVGERPRRGLHLRVAAMPMIGRGRTLVAFVLEGDERAGRRPVDAGQPSVGHRGDDTRRCGR